MPIFRRLHQFAAIVATSLLIGGACAFADGPVAALPSETPAKFTPKTDDFDYVKRQEMIPMRDGTKLKTFILVRKGA